MKPWEQPISQSVEKKIMSYVSDTKDKKLFDFGAGHGRYLDMFAKYFDKSNLFSAEIDTDSLKKIKIKGFNCYKPKYKDPVLPFDDNFFSYVFSSNVVEHIPNKYYKLYLKEIRRVLSDDGIFLFGAPNYPYKRFFDIKKAIQTKMYKYYIFDDPTHINKLSILQYEKDLSKYFSEICLKPTQLIFQKRIKAFQNNPYKYRKFTDKFFGYCKGVIL